MSEAARVSPLSAAEKMLQNEYSIQMTKKNNDRKNDNVKPVTTKARSRRSASQQITVPGALLLEALFDKAHQRKHTLAEMSMELGVTYGYINQLRTGLRKITLISDQFAVDCAHYLGMTRLEVLLLAERISPDDLFETADIYEEQVDRALRYMCEDNKWSHLITNELRSASLDSRFGLVRLYEEATGTILMPKRADIGLLVAKAVSPSARGPQQRGTSDRTARKVASSGFIKGTAGRSGLY